MPVLPNQRHERFAQGLAKGKSGAEAYTDAGYKGDRTAASRLATNVNVQRRVQELQERAAEKVGVTIESLTEELEAARLHAMAAESGASAAVAATMGKAKLHGFLVERSENINHNIDVTDEPATEDEWADQHAPN